LTSVGTAFCRLANTNESWGSDLRVENQAMIIHTKH